MTAGEAINATHEFQEPQHWIAVTEDGNGKITIFDKRTFDSQAFVDEVRGWGNTILCVYRKEDIIKRCTL